MAEESDSIVTRFIDGIAVVRFNQPAQRNALSLATLNELDETLAPLLSREDLKAIIFTGTDDVFTSGADLRELARLNPATALEFSRFGQDLFQRIADARQVTFAAINGYCMGGGLDLALACDIRIASKAAVFSHPGARRGIITGWGGTQRLPRVVGRANAFEFFATARRYSSEEALEIGLISRITDPVLGEALKLAQQSPGKKGAELRPGAYS
jgi:enoyl-CoA hydratase/carnithine racemase